MSVDLVKRTVREVATVTVSEPVDGTVKRKRRKPTTRRVKAVMVKDFQVRRDVMEAARKARRPGEVISIVSAECVLLVPK